MDGANIAVCRDGLRVTYCSRTGKSVQPQLVPCLDALFSGPDKEELFEQKFGTTEATLFGEGYGPSIQNGGLYASEPQFILFDVRNGSRPGQGVTRRGRDRGVPGWAG